MWGTARITHRVRLGGAWYITGLNVITAAAGALGRLGVLAMFVMAACGKPRPVAPPAAPGKVTFAVLPAESETFPKAAKATTASLTRARVKGLDEPQVSKVSLEVVQLSIECVEPTVDCYGAVGKSLSANVLLFAEIDTGPRPKTLRVRVTLFDVDAKQARRAAEKIFSDEEDAAYGIGDVVAEATRP